MVSVCFIKVKKNSGIHTIKVRLDAKASLLHVACVLNESELLPELVPVPTTCDEVWVDGYYHKGLTSEIKLLWPISNRLAHAEVQITDHLDQDNCFYVYGNELDENHPLGGPPKDKAGAKVDIHASSARIEYNR
eukprot:UN05111